MKEIKLIPFLDACDFSEEVEEELCASEISTHYNNDVLYISDWEKYRYPLTQEWLIETYGDKIKDYKQFGIAAT